ncbi:hypothetical protein PHYPSEUDO_004570 [Phytophthora pseudosyringae]|uniref:F-box domain-containing protein n=1 Tax=Phytophthora pseudosyringae TaxID=221518 RepID=A0A8T1WHA3_9STRA|nr:hypothetical protein PHYPSEUDO_004570 [Phytophthora pseudosyringae]
MLLELADECKQHIWELLGMQDLCRVACVARSAELGVRMGPIWQRHARTLLTKGHEALNGDTGVLGCRLQRRNASRNLLAPGDKHQTMAMPPSEEEELLGMHDTIDWRLWCRDTHVALVRFCANNTGFDQALGTLQELKAERSQLKEAMQTVKASSHADKRTRRIQMNCLKWMNRTHRRQAAASHSIQAQNAALSKAEVAQTLQSVEHSIQATTKEQFGLRKRAIKCVHKLNRQLASGTKLLRDLGAHTDTVKFVV